MVILRHVREFADLPTRSLALAAWMALMVALHATPSRADDRADIRSLMMLAFDKPDNRLVVEPVVVVGNSAVASWTQGERGGRALLRRGSSEWRIVLCSGDPLRSASMLVEAGVPAVAAEQLASLLKESESILPAKQVELFSTFEGVVHVDAEQGHGQGKDGHRHEGHAH
jgi:hypothetical protein